jgi:hypothetical protein
MKFFETFATDPILASNYVINNRTEILQYENVVPCLQTLKSKSRGCLYLEGDKSVDTINGIREKGSDRWRGEVEGGGGVRRGGDEWL